MRYLIILICVLFASCNTCKYVSKHSECFPPDTIKIFNERIVKDTITYIKENESTWEAYLECDSNNKVLIRKIFETNKGSIKPTIVYKDNVLKIRYYTDSIAVLHKIINETRNKEVTVMNPINIQMQKDLDKAQKKLHKWKKLGTIGLGLIALIIVYFGFKIFKKFI